MADTGSSLERRQSSDPSQTPQRRPWTPAQRHTLLVLLLFTLAMLILPIASFFLFQTYIFEGLLGFERASSGVGSAVVAVLVVHVIIAGYVWVAYNEEQPQTKKD